MAKTCIFCGNPPEKKNKEHVIPKWLIELTGDPNRSIRVGYSYGNDFKPIDFAISSLVFPACESCNSTFSILENFVKEIVVRVLENREVSEYDLNLLLDWFDKVRVGLWLGYFNLDDFMRVHPNFHIAQRIGQKDRLLFVYKSNVTSSGIIMSGVQTPVFRLLPSCFGLCINDTFFLNASLDSLVSRRLGFPFIADWQSVQGKNLEEARYAKGMNRISAPVLRFPYPVGATAFYQPIFKHTPLSLQNEGWVNQYVMDNALDVSSGLGRVFWSKAGDRVQRFPGSPTSEWVPNRRYEHGLMVKNHSLNVLGLQNFIIGLAPGTDRLASAEARGRRKIASLAKNFNLHLMKATRLDKRRLVKTSEAT